MTTRLEAKALTAGYDGAPVVRAVDLALKDGDFAAIVGPNGSGKSTLLKLLAGLLRPMSGAALLDERDIRAIPRDQLARTLALLPQTATQAAELPAHLTVRELVGFGRYAHADWLRRLRARDHDAVERALEACDMTDLAERHLAELSGGERQRARIAMALAQDAPILLLDEPVAALDVAHQLRLLALLERLSRDRGLTVLMVLHDLNLAARHCRRLIGMKDGRIVADGSAEDVLTPGSLHAITGLEATIAPDPVTTRPTCYFHDPS